MDIMHSPSVPEIGGESRGVMPQGLQRTLALAASVGAFMAAGSALAPKIAFGQEDLPQGSCTTTSEPVPNGGTKITEKCTYTYPDGSTNTSEKSTTTYGDSPPSPVTETAPAPTPTVTLPTPRPKPAPRPSKPRRSPKRQTQSASSERSFTGFNMAADPFTSGNGCFITAAASALRRETGNESITPRSLYEGRITQQWNPSRGVISGSLFDSLPSMAARYGVSVRKAGAAGVRAALREGDQAMVLFAPGYFAGGSGHYMAIRKALSNGRFILDDPNGKGKQGNSERSSGWSPRELQQRGVLKYRVLSR